MRLSHLVPALMLSTLFLSGQATGLLVQHAEAVPAKEKAKDAEKPEKGAKDKAAKKKGKDDHGKGGEGDSDKDIARSVDLSGLVFPVFDDSGELQNYLFVNARMLVADGKDPFKYRDKGHFIRDAVLRAAHRKSLNVKGDYHKLDEKVAAEICVKAANDAIGEPGALVSITFTQIASQS